jgi:ABC-2 type transport system permease protein
MEDPWDLSALVADKDLGVSRSMMDFYAVTMIVMIAFMGGGIGGAFTMYQARKDGLLRRMVCSPRSRTRLFLEAVVGVIPQNILQALIVMILSTVFLGVHYAKTWQENLLLFAFFIVVGMAVTAVFMLIGLFVRVNPYMPLMGGLWALLFMSGSFSKDMVIDGVSEYLPPNIIQRAAFDLTLFGRAEQMWTVMAVCGALLAFACALGVVIFRKKEIVF